MHKIIPLVLFVSVSLIIGNQVAFAETDIWAFYGEEFGSAKDATNPGDAAFVPPLSSLTGVETTPSVFQIDKLFEEYQNVDNAATAAKSGPLLVARCFEGIPNPKDFEGMQLPLPPAADWVFGSATDQAAPFQCVQNQRAARDLGLGVRLPVTPAQGAVQELEVEVGQLVVIDLREILGTYENFMFRISSNSDGEESWVATSDKAPEGILAFPEDFTPIGPADGFFPGCTAGEKIPEVCLNNDAYISFDPQGERYLYYTQTTRERDNLLQQIKADKMELVGGYGGITDNTALLVSGSHLTASWMIPLLISAIGIGVFVVTRK